MSRKSTLGAALFLATSVVASCGGRVDLGGSGAHDSGSLDAGAVATGSGGNDGTGGASLGGAESGGIEGRGGAPTDSGTIDGARGTGGTSSGGTTGDGGASGSAGKDGGATGGAPENGGSSSGGATTEAAGGTTATGGASSGGASDAGGITGAACTYNWDCIADAAGCDTTLGGCACDVTSHVCVATHCVDQRRDGTESDVDCGGECAGCGPGKVCYHDTDCSADAIGCDQCACDVLTSTCVRNHCADHKLDLDETGLDCGGTTCAGCAVGVTCKADSDCKWGGCDTLSHTCTSSTCYDHHIDGLETDIDCGGSGGCNYCWIGQKCATNFDCPSGHFCNTSKVCQ